MFGLQLQPDPATALLNLKPGLLTLIQFKLFVQLLTVAKQTLAKAWRSPTLVVAETKNRMTNAMIHAKMVAIDNALLPKFEKQWHPWITHHLPSNFDENVLLPW